MDRLGLAPEVIEIEPSGPIEDPRIVRGTVGDGKQLVYFHGHFDVVRYSTGPVRRATRRRQDHRTGTADMKGGIVSMLYGAAAAKELGLLGDAESSSTWSATRRPAAPSAPVPCDGRRDVTIGGTLAASR